METLSLASPGILVLKKFDDILYNYITTLWIMQYVSYDISNG